MSLYQGDVPEEARSIKSALCVQMQHYEETMAFSNKQTRKLLCWIYSFIFPFWSTLKIAGLFWRRDSLGPFELLYLKALYWVEYPDFFPLEIYLDGIRQLFFLAPAAVPESALGKTLQEPRGLFCGKKEADKTRMLQFFQRSGEACRFLQVVQNGKPVFLKKARLHTSSI